MNKFEDEAGVSKSDDDDDEGLAFGMLFVVEFDVCVVLLLLFPNSFEIKNDECDDDEDELDEDDDDDEELDDDEEPSDEDETGGVGRFMVVDDDGVASFDDPVWFACC